MAAPVTESLVDAKDDARQTEVRTDIEKAIKSIERQFTQQTLWIVGFVLVAAGLVIAVLR